jgi:signal transduction histidine kinase
MDVKGETPVSRGPGEQVNDRLEAERAEQVLACLRSCLGHDMANHLVAIQGLLHILETEEGARLSAASKAYLQRIRNVAERVATLARTLADICRDGRDTQLPESQSLVQTAREVATEVTPLFSGGAIQYDFPEVPFFLTVSRGALRRVLLQLLKNAVQAGRDGERARIEIGVGESDSCRQFWIADHGRGLPADALGRLREFFSGKPWTGPGNGLGLMIVRQTVDRWGGQVLVDSEPGRGTVFTVRLPRVAQAPR